MGTIGSTVGRKGYVTGGQGADWFLFEEGESSADKSQADVIKDFSHAQDDLIYLNSIDGVLEFVGSAAFTKDHQVRVTTSGGDSSSA